MKTEDYLAVLTYMSFSIWCTYRFLVPEIKDMYAVHVANHNSNKAKFALVMWYTAPVWGLLFFPIAAVILVFVVPVGFYSMAHETYLRVTRGFRERWKKADYGEDTP